MNDAKTASLPRVLVNAMPKNGTHLLLSVLAGLPGFSDSEAKQVHWGKQNRDRALETLAATLPGQYTKAHLPFNGRIIDFLQQQNFRVLNMQRDPRDNVVSLLFYIRRYKDHPFYPVLEPLSDDEALMQLIAGFEGKPRFNPVGQRLSNWQGWFDHPYCLTVRFENLIGAFGGGCDDSQRDEIARILAYIGCDNRDAAVAELAATLTDRRTHSFRKGAIGDWRNHFNAEHKRVFRQQANGFLLSWGYETGDDW